jgi:hypothetical protein
LTSSSKTSFSSNSKRSPEVCATRAATDVTETAFEARKASRTRFVASESGYPMRSLEAVVGFRGVSTAT